MRDLAVLNATNRSTDYFVNVLSQMLGIPKEKVADLRFIRAYRYFLHCMDTLAAISKRFADLKIEPTDEERQAPDRPPRPRHRRRGAQVRADHERRRIARVGLRHGVERRLRSLRVDDERRDRAAQSQQDTNL